MNPDLPEACTTVASGISVGVLRHVPTFEGLDSATLAMIAKTASLKTLGSGERLIRKGDAADALYLVLTGRFRVVSDGATIATIGPGEPIGELAFFACGQRTADVLAMRDSTLLALDRQSYDNTVAAIPGLASGILATVAARLAALTARAAALPPHAGRVVTLVGAGNGPLPQSLIDGLQAAAARHGGLMLHDGSAAPVDAGPAALGEWMRALETAGGRNLLVIRDANVSPVWARFAAGSGDSLIVAGPPGCPSAPFPRGIEVRAQAATYPPVTQLLLRRARADRPIRGTLTWLAGRSVARHHHLALDRPADFDRLIRFCCDEARGLTPGRGEAFGSAYLGADKALQEAGIAIDFLGGTSVGAAMAAAISRGLEMDEIMRRTNDVFVTNRAMARLTAPLCSVLNHRTFDELFEKHLGTDPVEDMALNLIAVASNLSRNGPLWKAVRISKSIPAMLPPMLTDEGEVLIDRGLVDTHPLRVMREPKSGPNTAMDFQQGRAWPVEADNNALPRPLGAAAGLVPGRSARPARARRFRRMATVLSRAMTMNSRRLITQTDFGDDVLIDLPIVNRASFLYSKRGHDHYDHAHRMPGKALAAADSAHDVASTGTQGDPAIARLHAAADLLESGD